MKEPIMLQNKQELSVLNIKGSAYIKDSEGKSANLELAIIVKIDTQTNAAVISYGVIAFYPKSPDYVNISFDNYANAIIKYNELATQFNGYR